VSDSEVSWSIEWHACLDSTMDRAAELAERGAAVGTVVVADYQRAGRGTHGRSWLAPPGTCLMFTMLLRPSVAPEALTAMPTRIGQSIADALNATFGLGCTVKHPNDILSTGKKLCGVLCTSRVVGDRVAWLLCGVGLNTFMTHAALPHAEATSLALEGARVPPHPELLTVLLAGLEWLRDVNRHAGPA
jgi:BirA family biotin operon repressor/biotin-[acetyl-CoA-carboxylase] ligase